MTRSVRLGPTPTRPGWPSAQSVGPEFAVGHRLAAGRFEILGELGRGGMATVYRALDLHARSSAPVALKILDAAQARRPARHARFMAEAALTARLPSHAGVVQWRAHGTLAPLADRPFLCTECVDGPTLAFELATQTFPLDPPAMARAVDIATALADGLRCVHARAVVHRDLTARNVVLGHDAGRIRPVLIDFGMAAQLSSDGGRGAARLTAHDERPGTVTAMAPEQFCGASPCAAMDIYAWGRLAYHLLTGEDPHAWLSTPRLGALHRAGRRVAPRIGERMGERAGSASMRLVHAVIDACLEPLPGDRPSAAQVHDTLVRVRRGIESAAVLVVPRVLGPRTVVKPPVEPVPRRRARRWPAAVMLAGVAVALGVWRPPVEDPGPPPLAVGRPAELVEGRLHWPRWIIPAVSTPSAVTTPTVTPSKAPPRPVVSRRPGPEATVPAVESSHCRQQRAQAEAAVRRWSWTALLRTTRTPGCWSPDAQRLRLRLTAWIELRRFDACVREGGASSDPAIGRMVARCARREVLAEANRG